MAVDSIIARPTNRVRVMVAEASGCCASAVSAVATERPSPRAGAIHPTLIVMPEVTMEATAMLVMLSIVLYVLWLLLSRFKLLEQAQPSRIWACERPCRLRCRP